MDSSHNLVNLKSKYEEASAGASSAFTRAFGKKIAQHIEKAIDEAG